MRAERPDSSEPIAFRCDLAALAERSGAGGLALLMQDLDRDSDQFRGILAKISNTIRVGPVRYAGTDWPAVLWQESKTPAGIAAPDNLGWVVVPTAVWLDLVRFDHWVEDSVILRWAERVGIGRTKRGELHEWTDRQVVRPGSSARRV